LPIDHPETTEDMVGPEMQRCRQLVGVLSLGSTSPGSRLLKYCADPLPDKAFAGLRELRDTCQKKMDAISRMLLDEQGLGDNTGPAPIEGLHIVGDASVSVIQSGILYQPPTGWVSPFHKIRFQNKVAAFDLDGTLLRGDNFVFSWELVWQTLGFGIGIQSDLKRQYRRIAKGASREVRIAAYQDWCGRAVDNFKSRGLTRSGIRQMTQQLRLTRNCREAIKALRDQGIVTAMISGGINTILEDTFADYREYFDFVFINELLFDNSGLISGVRATAYDFEGKAEALALVRERAGASTEETVFIGDHFNDEEVMVQARTAIAYPPSDKVARTVANHIIENDDLLQVVPLILVE
jgi:HAD superfamily phosphoserine phosphatase-like hydrolase